MKHHLLFAGVLAATSLSASAINLTSAGSPYTQNFDALATTGNANSWANDSTLPGWHLFRQPAPGTAITSYAAGDGSVNPGSFYSYGRSGSAERALGGLGSGGSYFGSPPAGSIAGWIAASFVNSSGSQFTGFTASWTGEQWRNGGNAAAHSMVFEYGFGANFGDVSSWTAPGSTFDWASPVVGSTAAAVDGNVAGLVTGVGGTIASLNWSVGDTLWLRWIERNDTGNDHGLAIDDFSFVALGSTSPVPDASSTALLLAIPLFGLWTMRRLTCRIA